jgi:hypothetical protein
MGRQKNSLDNFSSCAALLDLLNSCAIVCPFERAVLFYAQWLAEHEAPHVKQIGGIASTLRAEQ